MIKVSVIVPVYNVEKYIDRCIQSLLRQTLKEIEIILVDDESPDNCPYICDNYANKYDNVKVIHKKNAGLGMARNSGLEIASGEYVTFCDSDDWLDIEAYENIYNICKLKDLDMCSFQFRRVTIDGKKIEMKEKENEFFIGKKNVRKYLLGLIGKDYTSPTSKNYGMSSCMSFFKREKILISGTRYPSERIIASEDLVFLLNLVPNLNNIGVVSNVYYNYLINPLSISQNYSQEKYLRLMNLISMIKDYCDKNFLWEEYKNHYYSQLLRIYKLIIKFTSISEFSFYKKHKIILNILKDSYLEPLLKDPVQKYYPLFDKCYLFCIKYKLSFCFIILYNFKKVIRAQFNLGK